MSADMPEMSIHARVRWAERCKGLDPESEWATARRAGAKAKKKIRRGCPAHAHLLADRTYRGYWYMVSRHRVVFVVDGEREVVITVWRLPIGMEVE